MGENGDRSLVRPDKPAGVARVYTIEETRNRKEEAIDDGFNHPDPTNKRPSIVVDACYRSLVF